MFWFVFCYLDNDRVIWEKGTSIEKMPHQICPWASLWYISWLITGVGGGGEGQLTMRGATPGLVVLEKQAKKHHSSFRDGLCNNWLLIPALFRVPTLTSLSDGLCSGNENWNKFDSLSPSWSWSVVFYHSNRNVKLWKTLNALAQASGLQRRIKSLSTPQGMHPSPHH